MRNKAPLTNNWFIVLFKKIISKFAVLWLKPGFFWGIFWLFYDKILYSNADSPSLSSADKWQSREKQAMVNTFKIDDSKVWNYSSNYSEIFIMLTLSYSLITYKYRTKIKIRLCPSFNKFPRKASEQLKKYF